MVNRNQSLGDEARDGAKGLDQLGRAASRVKPGIIGLGAVTGLAAASTGSLGIQALGASNQLRVFQGRLDDVKNTAFDTFQRALGTEASGRLADLAGAFGGALGTAASFLVPLAAIKLIFGGGGGAGGAAIGAAGSAAKGAAGAAGVGLGALIAGAAASVVTLSAGFLSGARDAEEFSSRVGTLQETFNSLIALDFQGLHDNLDQIGRTMGSDIEERSLIARAIRAASEFEAWNDINFGGLLGGLSSIGGRISGLISSALRLTGIIGGGGTPAHVDAGGRPLNPATGGGYSANGLGGTYGANRTLILSQNAHLDRIESGRTYGSSYGGNRPVVITQNINGVVTDTAELHRLASRVTNNVINPGEVLDRADYAY